MHVSPITVNMSYMHTYLRDAWPYTFCVPKSAAVWAFYCLCSTNWDQRLCKTSLGNTRSEVFTIQKAKIQIWTTAVWIGVLDLFVLNCSDLLSLTDTWNSEIPAQLMTGMWTYCLPGRPGRSDQFIEHWALQVEGLFPVTFSHSPWPHFYTFINQTTDSVFLLKTVKFLPSAKYRYFYNSPVRGKIRETEHGIN